MKIELNELATQMGSLSFRLQVIFWPLSLDTRTWYCECLCDALRGIQLSRLLWHGRVASAFAAALRKTDRYRQPRITSLYPAAVAAIVVYSGALSAVDLYISLLSLSRSFFLSVSFYFPATTLYVCLYRYV